MLKLRTVVNFFKRPNWEKISVLCTAGRKLVWKIHKVIDQ